MQLVSLILIRWIVIYPVDSTIQRLNNRGLVFNTIVLPNINYALSVYATSESDLTPVQCFLDRCFKRKYTSKPVSVYDFLERQDRKIFRKVSNAKGHPLLSIMPLVKPSREELVLRATVRKNRPKS